MLLLIFPEVIIQWKSPQKNTYCSNIFPIRQETQGKNKGFTDHFCIIYYGMSIIRKTLNKNDRCEKDSVEESTVCELKLNVGNTAGQ